MENIKELKKFEDALMQHLEKGGINKTSLKSVSSEIVNLRKNGLLIDQVSVAGQINADKIIINGKIDPDFWRNFKNLGKGFNRFEVFPYGIVLPEGFRFTSSIRI